MGLQYAAHNNSSARSRSSASVLATASITDRRVGGKRSPPGWNASSFMAPGSPKRIGKVVKVYAGRANLTSGLALIKKQASARLSASSCLFGVSQPLYGLLPPSGRLGRAANTLDTRAEPPERCAREAECCQGGREERRGQGSRTQLCVRAEQLPATGRVPNTSWQARSVHRACLDSIPIPEGALLRLGGIPSFD